MKTLAVLFLLLSGLLISCSSKEESDENLSYQWFAFDENGDTLALKDNDVYSGTHSCTLTIKKTSDSSNLTIPPEYFRKEIHPIK